MNIDQLYCDAAEERQIHIQENPELEKRIAKRLGLHRKTPRWSFFFAPAVAFAALVGMASVSPATVDAAQEAAQNIFFNYGLATTSNPWPVALIVFGTSAIVTFVIVVLFIRRHINHPITRNILIAAVLLAGISPLIVYGLSMITYTISGTIHSASCEDGNLLQPGRVTIETEHGIRTISLPVNNLELTRMQVLNAFDQPIGGWTSAEFCDASTSPYFFKTLENIPFEIGMNGLGQVTNWKALEPLPILGGVSSENDVTLWSIIWGSDTQASGRADAIIEDGGHEIARISYESSMAWPLLSLVTNDSIIMPFQSEIGCNWMVYIINRHDGTVKKIDDKGCYLSAWPSEDLVFASTDLISTVDNDSTTESWAVNGIGKYATTSPDGSRMAIIIWNGSFDDLDGSVYVYTAGHPPVEVKSGYHQMVSWVDNDTLQLDTDGATELVDIE